MPAPRHSPPGRAAVTYAFFVVVSGNLPRFNDARTRACQLISHAHVILYSTGKVWKQPHNTHTFVNGWYTNDQTYRKFIISE